jgi:hypothetical protein
MPFCHISSPLSQLAILIDGWFRIWTTSLRITRNLDENRITAGPHLAFSPDLAPFDFFLFGVLKGELSGHTYESPDELVEIGESGRQRVVYRPQLSSAGSERGSRQTQSSHWSRISSTIGSVNFGSKSRQMESSRTRRKATDPTPAQRLRRTGTPTHATLVRARGRDPGARYRTP